MNRFRKMSRRARELRPRKRLLDKLLSRVGGGIIAGLLMAALLSGFLLLAALVRGSTYYPQYDITTWQAIRGYLLAAILAGAVFGLLQPLARTRGGATLVGLLVGPFAYGALAAAIGGSSELVAWTAIVPGVLVGGVVGFMLGKPEKA